MICGLPSHSVSNRPALGLMVGVCTYRGKVPSSKPEAQAEGTRRSNPGHWPFGGVLSETERWKARGASRGNARRGPNNVISLSLRFLMLRCVKPKSRKPEARAEGMRFGDRVT